MIFHSCYHQEYLDQWPGKAIPLGACSASSFYIELELETQNNIFADTTGTLAVLSAITISDVVFNAKVAVLPDDINNLLMASVMNRIVIPSTSWKVELKTLNAKINIIQ